MKSSKKNDRSYGFLLFLRTFAIVQFFAHDLPNNKAIQVSEAMNCLEDSTMSNPVHTSETRMCGGEALNLYYSLEGST